MIVARTFSKIAALAGMRLGYAVAPAEHDPQMRPYSMGSINALVKWGGVASLKDTGGAGRREEEGDRSAQEDHRANSRRYGYEVPAVGDQLLHGGDRP